MASTGNRAALDALIPAVYDQLCEIARSRLRVERTDHTLDTSGLVHEAYLRVVDSGGTVWHDRGHFFAVASTAMRHILIDHARGQRALKRGGDRSQVDLDVSKLAIVDTAAEDDPETLLALDDALHKLERLHPRQAKAIELRYFASLTLEETAETLATSAPTVLRDLRFAQAWLARELG